MTVTLENKVLKAEISHKGAELTSLYNKDTLLEYMWNGDPAFWAKHSPLLFPIVGTLKNDEYHFNGKPYTLPRHGFAREQVFGVEEQKSDSVIFVLHNSPETEKVYPFKFKLEVKYTLLDNALTVTYRVSNPDKTDLYFSVGAHPAFAVPLANGTSYDDYYIEFEKEEEFKRWPISKDGLIQTQTEDVVVKNKRLQLTKALFEKDALVFKFFKSSVMHLKSDKSSNGLEFTYPGFPFLGIWAFKGADFVCLEPWCGVADSVDTDQDFTKKEGINKLAGGDSFERSWTVKTF